VNEITAWHPGSLRRARDADRFFGIGHGHRRHHVRLRVGEGSDLRRVIGFRLVGVHQRPRIVAVATRSDAAADHDGDRFPFMRIAKLDHQLDGLAIDGGKRRVGIAELRAPIFIGAPGRTVEDETASVALRDVEIGAVIAAKPLQSLLRAQQIERREIWKIDPLMEDQRGLQTAI